MAGLWWHQIHYQSCVVVPRFHPQARLEKDEAEDEEWDPDFEEFDLPKSKGKKAVGGAKKGAEEEEDFKVDDEFKDLFNDGASLDEDEEDDF